MPDRFTARRLIEAYTGTWPHPEVYAIDFKKHQELFPMIIWRQMIIDSELADNFESDLEALVEFAIEQALAGKLESL